MDVGVDKYVYHSLLIIMATVVKAPYIIIYSLTADDLTHQGQLGPHK
jgi:hypothetical protein